MKYLLFTDIHFHEFPEFATYEDGMSSRLRLCQNSVLWLEEIARKEGVKHLINLGDTHHKKEFVRTPVLKLAYESFEHLAKCGFELHFLLGNHDLYTRNTAKGVHSLAQYRGLGFVHDVPKVQKVGDDMFFFIPYFKDKNLLLTEVLEVREPSLILCFHNQITPIKTTEYDIEVRTLIEVPDAHLRQFKAVFAGDIHKRQQVGAVAYIGSLLAHDFGDAGDERGAVFFDSETKTFTSYMNPFSPFFFKWTFENNTFDPIMEFVKGRDKRTPIFGDFAFTSVALLRDFQEFHKKNLDFLGNLQYRKRVVSNVQAARRTNIDRSGSFRENFEHYLKFNPPAGLDPNVLLQKAEQYYAMATGTG